jgi:cytidylate kinase
LNVITISRTYGSGGSEFGKSLAKELGFQYVDGAFLTSMKENPQKYSSLYSTIEDEVGPGFLSKISGLLNNRSFFKTSLAVCIYELALKTDIILAGAGGHLFLSGFPSLISIQVIRKLSSRVRIVAKQTGLKLEEALKLVEAKDKTKSEFIRYYFDKEFLDPFLFHLTINGNFFTLEDALLLVADYAKSFFFRIDNSITELFLHDRLLEAKARMVLFHLNLSSAPSLNFHANAGELTIEGIVGGSHEKNEIYEMLKKIPEVRNIIDNTKIEVLSHTIY